jgi:hypothetical protein
VSLFSDPVKWAELVAKSKVRLICFIVVQFGFLIAVLWNLYDSMSLKGLFTDVSYSEFLISSSPILVLGAFFPSMYLYSMYCMINIIKERS